MDMLTVSLSRYIYIHIYISVRTCILHLNVNPILYVKTLNIFKMRHQSSLLMVLIQPIHATCAAIPFSPVFEPGQSCA